MIEVRHAGIAVWDLRRALHFYCDLLGLVIVRRAHEHGSHLDAMLGTEGVDVTTLKLRADTGPTLVELLAFEYPQPYPEGEREIYDPGPSHIAFTVTDLDAICARLREAGVPFRSEPQPSPDGRARVCFCADPDGTPIELVEMQG